jgi:membrane protein YdbS with pleckstrin-like domain
MSEFLDKWKRGILSVSELQKIIIQIRSTWLVILGIGLGLAVMFYNAKTFWWMIIILIAAMVNTLVGLVGLYQKKIWLTKVEQDSFLDEIKYEETATAE